MLDFFRKLLAVDFMPHIYCLRQGEVVWLHVISDAFIALAYLAIPIALCLLIRRRQDLAFSGIFWLFALFILACGATHVLGIVTLWHPVYRLEGLVKAITAGASVLTAFATFRLLPQAVALPSVSRLEVEMEERKKIEASVRELNATLEARVEERTRDLQLSNARFRAAADAVGDVLWTNSADGRMTGEQPGWAALTGQSLEEYQDYGWSQAVHPDDAQPTIDAWNAAVAERGTFVFEHRVRRKDGAWRRFSIRGVPVLDERGEILEWVGVHRDITEERERVLELQHAYNLAESSSRAKSTFLANMSHELRTPLNAIIGYSEMLIEQAREASVVRDLNVIQTAGRHLLSIINSVLDLSKIEAGKMDVAVENFDLEALVSDVKALIEPLADRNGNRLTTRVAPEARQMRSDATKVRQMLINLVGNAAKFTERGEIRLDISREGEQILFRIVDTGIGMDERQCERVFEAFAQADAATATRFGGTGLGLAICKKFAELLGGGVHCQSVKGQGTTFTLELPVALASP
jgi:PAS domain S-box-containing protein